MKSRVIRFITQYLGCVIIMVAMKMVFMLSYCTIYSDFGIADLSAALLHGLSMDMAVGGYLMILPGIILVASSIVRCDVVDRMLRIYWTVMMAVLAMIELADIVLYGYWGFKLDMTPIFYFTSSPKLAMASAEWWMIPLAVIAWCAMWMAFSWFMRLMLRISPISDQLQRRSLTAVLMLLFTGVLILPIRGGLTVSTMNMSYAYFSPSMPLNHAAVNPAFSLLYSMGHQQNFGNQFRYYNSSDDAWQAAGHLLALEPGSSEACDSSMLGTDRPDIYLIILESFSAKLMPSLGGEPVALGLDSIANSGGSLLFTHFFANSFRTDRGIPSILSGVPAPPTTSLMKHAEIAENMPDIASVLRDAGYSTHYYYGGDINFTNQLAYLRAGGFGHIVSDKDFPISLRMSKWGVDDGPLFDRVAADILSAREPEDRSPRFVVIQTSSSHEPYHVPMETRHPEPAANAFIYADSCMTHWINTLAASDCGKDALVVIVPDHYGAWPKNLSFADRHHVPLVLTGGALKRTGTIDIYGSQKDMAATLLNMLGLDSSAFPLSRDMLDNRNAGYAFFSEPDMAGVINQEGVLTTEVLAGSDVSAGDTSVGDTATVRAFLQVLYDYAEMLRKQNR